MAKKLKWKRTRDGQIIFQEKKTLGERFRNVGYMQVSLMTFAASLVTLFAGLGWATGTNGGANSLISILWILTLVFAGAGVGVTRYGHYTVEAESKLSWKIGMYTNGGVIAASVLIYLLGLIFG